MLKTGTVVDATIVAALSSTKNQDGERCPEMHQTKTANQWQVGMKAHIGVDAESGLVHTVVGTSTNVNGRNADRLSSRSSRVACLDAAYMVTRRIWLCTALHVGWNFTLGHLFSLAVSGHDRTAGLIEGILTGPAWLTGGAYGIEASAITLAVLTMATAWLLNVARGRGNLVTWSGRETAHPETNRFGAPSAT